MEFSLLNSHLEFQLYVSIFLFCQLCISKPKSLLSGNEAQLANTACIVPKLSSDIALGEKSFWIAGLQELVFNTNSGVTKFPPKNHRVSFFVIQCKWFISLIFIFLLVGRKQPIKKTYFARPLRQIGNTLSIYSNLNNAEGCACILRRALLFEFHRACVVSWAVPCRWQVVPRDKKMTRFRFINQVTHSCVLVTQMCLVTPRQAPCNFGQQCFFCVFTHFRTTPDLFVLQSVIRLVCLFFNTVMGMERALQVFKALNKLDKITMISALALSCRLFKI